MNYQNDHLIYFVLFCFSRLVLHSPSLVQTAVDAVDNKELQSEAISHQTIADISEGTLKKDIRLSITATSNITRPYLQLVSFLATFTVVTDASSTQL